MNIKSSLTYRFYNIMGRLNPKWVANRRYRNTFGRNIDWNHPTEFNEKIRWMQFYTDTSKWSLLADKYQVRKYLEGKGHSDILVKLYGVWDKAEDIDFDVLPDSFVLKTNHGYGEVVIVRDKAQIDKDSIRRRMSRFQRTPFGYNTAEVHYLKIKPVIIAEELLNNDLPQSTSIVDYKFYCFKGEPYCCGAFYDRGKGRKVSFFDMDWVRHDEWRADRLRNVVQKDIPKPATFDQMKSVCKELAAEFPFVRMDFYESNGKLYFGEFTFTPAALSGGSLSKSLLQQMSSLLELDR